MSMFFKNDPDGGANAPRRTLPALPLRDIIVFPHMVSQLFVGRERSIAALDEAMAQSKEIFLAAQRSAGDPGHLVTRRHAGDRGRDIPGPAHLTGRQGQPDQIRADDRVLQREPGPGAPVPTVAQRLERLGEFAAGLQQQSPRPREPISAVAGAGAT